MPSLRVEGAFYVTDPKGHARRFAFVATIDVRGEAPEKELREPLAECLRRASAKVGTDPDALTKAVGTPSLAGVALEKILSLELREEEKKGRTTVEPPRASARDLRVGMTVAAQWTDGGYYRATIAEIEDDRFLAKWEDGGEPTWVKAEQLRLQGPAAMPPAILAPGMRVHAPWTDGKLYPGTIVAMRDGQVEVEWEDTKQTDWFLPVQVRPA